MQDQYYAKIRKRVVEEKLVVVNRSIYGKGRPKVKKGDRVVPETIVLEGEMPGGFRSIPAGQILGVNGKEISKYLVKNIGDKVNKGDRLAFRKTFGIFSREVVSPIPGIVREIDLDNGVISVQLLPEFDRISAACWGEVLEVGESSVKIKTPASEIFGVAGAGKSREGILKILTPRDEFLISENINDNLGSKIIVGGSLILRESFAKALALSVNGIIAGGMHTLDFVSAGGRIVENFSSSDVGMTVVLTEGFGPAPISQQIFEILKKNEGRLSIINGEEGKLTIPLKTDKKLEAYLSDKTEGVRVLKIGDYVRIIGNFELGFEGKLTSINKSTQRLSNGLEVILATVKNSVKEVKVPVQNLEIIV